MNQVLKMSPSACDRAPLFTSCRCRLPTEPSSRAGVKLNKDTDTYQLRSLALKTS